MHSDLRSYDFRVRKTRAHSLFDTVFEDLHPNMNDGISSQAAHKVAGAAMISRQYAWTLFDKLPIELNQRIAEYIENDDDVSNFRDTCAAASEAIDSDNMSFWRRRFLASFEKPLDVGSNADFKRLYLERKHVLRKGVGKDGFTIGIDDEGLEVRCLKVMRQLMLEAFSEKNARNGSTYRSKNLDFVINIAQSHGLFDAIFNPKHQQKRAQYREEEYRIRLLQIIQIMLAPCMLSFDIDTTPYRFPESQEVVYATADARPIFYGYQIDMEYVLHNINFWRYHMVRPDEALELVYRDLPDSSKPQFWSRQLHTAGKREIGRRWKGAYAYVDRSDIHDIRAGEGGIIPFQDEFSGAEVGSAFQDLELEVEIRGACGWSEVFEKCLHSFKLPSANNMARIRAQKRSDHPNDGNRWPPYSFRFRGKGSDDAEEFATDGWLNSLPAQSMIPGWQRMTMMKYYQDPVSEAIDYDALWAYEGVVLPGGQIMLGRWWCPYTAEEEEMYSGPFLLWCVDDSPVSMY